MGLSEADFIAQLLATFKVEAEEHLQVLSNTFVQLEQEPEGPSVQEQLEEVFREAHNLKGAARAVNQEAIEKICQALEDVLSALKRGDLKLSAPLFDTLYATVDIIASAIQKINKEEDTAHKELLQQMIERLQGAKEGREVKFESQKAQSSKPLKEPTPTEEISQPIPQQTTEEPAIEERTIRVSSAKLDRLLQQVEEMLIVKLAASQKVNELQTITKNVDDLSRQWKRIQTEVRILKQSLPHIQGISPKERSILVQILQFLDWYQEFISNFDETMQNTIQNTKQEQRIVTNMVDTLLEETKQVLMQPFSTLLASLPRMVRDISHSLGKEINFETEGGETEVDRRILEELKDPIIHLIRNGIDHGIESVEERNQAGKSKVGTIRININQTSGNKVILHISDDGRGIDVEKVKKAALKQGSISQKELEEMSREDALRLVFQSGLSTAQIISDLSGRGLGMGIVAEKVEKLGGEVYLETEEGKGSTFKIVLPITLATFRGISIRVSNQEFIMPTHHVMRTFKTSTDQIKTIESKPTVLVDGRPMAFVHLADVLNLKQKRQEDNSLHILVIKAAETYVAVGVDHIINEQEVFVKNLGPQLVRVKNITAATIMEAGRVVPIIDPFDLVKSVVQGSHSAPIIAPTENQAGVGKKQTKEKTILIAEDSVTARILIKNILSSAGYTVKTAVDGVEAISILKTEHVDLLMTDVEMPRMNGFQLAETVRKTEGVSQIPIVICTSLGSQEDREKGIEAGANAYIKKSSFTQSHLIEIIQQLL